MKISKEKLERIVSGAFSSLCWAIVGAWLGLIVDTGGWRALWIGVLPLVAAWHLGAERGWKKWEKAWRVEVRDLEKRYAREAVKRIDDVRGVS